MRLREESLVSRNIRIHLYPSIEPIVLMGQSFRDFVQSLTGTGKGTVSYVSRRRISSYTPTSNSLITQACDVISPNDL